MNKGEESSGIRVKEENLNRLAHSLFYKYNVYKRYSVASRREKPIIMRPEDRK